MKMVEDRKRKPSFRKFIIGIILVISILITTIFVGISLLRCSGKKNLYKGNKKNEMVFTSENIQMVDNEKYDIKYNGKKYKYNDDILTLLILGIDKTDKVTPAKNAISGGQSDGIFLVVMNPDTKKIDIIVVHRDTVSTIEVYDKEGNYVRDVEAQICLQHAYGDGMALSNNRTKEAVSNLFCRLPIHSVSSVNMGAIGEINDAIGGVTLESLESFSVDGCVFTEGESITLTGKSAYYYTKYRDINEHFTASKRINRQKQYLSKATDQLIGAIKKDVGVLTDVYSIAADYIVTDLSIDELTYLATEISEYTLGEVQSLKGEVDTSGTFEKYYLDVEEFEQMIIQLFYQEVK